MPSLSPQEISHLGVLSRLALTPEEQERFSGQLSSVVSYVEHLSGVNTDAVKDQRGVSGLTNVFAEDVVRGADDLCAIDSATLLAGAPLSEGNLILVRAVLSGEVVSA